MHTCITICLHAKLNVWMRLNATGSVHLDALSVEGHIVAVCVCGCDQFVFRCVIVRDQLEYTAPEIRIS